jgi:hypothetical protein
MPQTLARSFETRLAEAGRQLATITEETSRASVRPGGWSRRQVLGHLLDSAANNHQRFVRAALDGSYAGPGYAQEAWVALHGYAEWSWAALLASWRERNATLVRVLERMDAAALAAPCAIGGAPSVTLAFVIEDYLDHLEHHVRQIVDGATGPRLAR